MKKILALLFFLTVINDCFSQANRLVATKKYELNSVGDTYVVDVHLDGSIFQKKCNCASPVKGKCNLFTGKIKHIYHLPGKTVFDSVSLKDVKYFVVASTIGIQPGKDYLVTLTPGTTNRYLVLNNILNLKDPETYEFVNQGPYLSGFTECVRVGLLDKVLLSVGLAKPEKVYQNKKFKNDLFDEFIKTLNSH
ncbi:MAG TPA: hypothetical protein VK668_18225 [Mucilaginibacter sp.]|nr:hypothetical protein [Mucilaginibacter sp.]